MIQLNDPLVICISGCVPYPGTRGYTIPYPTRTRVWATDGVRLSRVGTGMGRRITGTGIPGSDSNLSTDRVWVQIAVLCVASRSIELLFVAKFSRVATTLYPQTFIAHAFPRLTFCDRLMQRDSCSTCELSVFGGLALFRFAELFCLNGRVQRVLDSCSGAGQLYCCCRACTMFI